METKIAHETPALKLNREYYDGMTRGQHDYWTKMAAPRFRVKTFLKNIKALNAASVVDFGCGNGALLSEIKKNYPHMKLSGVDLSEEQVKANKKLKPSISWHAHDLNQKLVFPEDMRNQFDVVIASEVIEHVDNPKQLLQNAGGLAKIGSGTLLLSTQSGTLGETERRVGHLRHYTTDEMSHLLKSAGWQPMKVWNAGFPFHDLSKRYANINPDDSMKQFGSKAYGPWENFVCLALRLAFKLNSNSRGAQLFAAARNQTQ